MKLISKTTLALAAATLLLVGCGGGSSSETAAVQPTKVEPKEPVAKPIIPEEDLGLRKTSLYEEEDAAPEPTSYRTEAQGKATKIKRAFQDAPPMIPHSVDGLLPITKDYNACTGCHMPDVAMYMDPKPTPIPPSHFMDMRPHHKFDGKKFEKAINNYNNETDVKKIDHLYQGRYNCSQCHAPQSRGNLAVQNTFEADYNRPGAEFKSTWDEVMLDDLDTVGKESKVTPEDVANKNSPAGVSAWKDAH